VAEIKIDDVKPDGKYIVKVICGECKTVLLESVELEGEELKSAWSNLVITKGFNTPACEKGCRPTYGDFNINSDMQIEEAAHA
jgi:predicted SPOUT superfamily RNA methylase MTH1